MPLSAKKMQELMKEKRRRDKLPPRPVIVEPVPLTLKPRELSQVTERCSSFLLAIESTLVQSARELSMVDDLVVKQALTCLIRHTTCEVEPVASIVTRLEAVRQSRQINDEDWSMSLRARVYSRPSSGSTMAAPSTRSRRTTRCGRPWWR